MSSRAALGGFERRLGVSLPAAMKRFFSKRRKLEYLQSVSVKEVVSLRGLSAGMAPRFLPIFSTRCGNDLGLCFPREKVRPFVVAWDHEEDIMFPIKASIRALFQNPDRFSHDHPANDGNYPPRDWEVCKPLLIRSASRTPELELLKPFSLHFRALEKCDRKVFGPLLRRFGSADPRARLIRRYFRKILDLHDRTKWIRLSEELAQISAYDEAVRSLENCLTIQTIHPWYGEPHLKDASVSWGKWVDILSRFMPLVKLHGDNFDRVTIARQLKVAREYARS